MFLPLHFSVAHQSQPTLCLSAICGLSLTPPLSISVSLFFSLSPFLSLFIYLLCLSSFPTSVFTQFLSDFFSSCLISSPLHPFTFLVQLSPFFFLAYFFFPTPCLTLLPLPYHLFLLLFKSSAHPKQTSIALSFKTQNLFECVKVPIKDKT